MDEKVKVSPWVLRAICSVGLVLLIQTLTAVWWASSISTHVQHMRTDIGDLKTEIHTRMQDRYTSSDAAADKVAHSQVHQLIMERIKRLEDK